MRMYTIIKNKVREIEDYVNEKGIEKKDIVDIFQTIDGSYCLIYYGQ